jgi:hypothetical protein
MGPRLLLAAGRATMGPRLLLAAAPELLGGAGQLPPAVTGRVGQLLPAVVGGRLLPTLQSICGAGWCTAALLWPLLLLLLPLSC